jgi:hypothetical protein
MDRQAGRQTGWVGDQRPFLFRVVLRRTDRQQTNISAFSIDVGCSAHQVWGRPMQLRMAPRASRRSKGSKPRSGWRLAELTVNSNGLQRHTMACLVACNILRERGAALNLGRRIKALSGTTVGYEARGALEASLFRSSATKFTVRTGLRTAAPL